MGNTAISLEDLSNSDNELTEIKVTGARENNLKNVNINIPRDNFVVVTGLSGSGKSSLAFDTLYAEGQRRYVECLSPYAKQFLGMMKKPEVDTIEGLSPAISIEQKSISHNPRSTVGTTTEIYNYIRLLFAKIGTQYCVDCDIPVVQKSLDQIIDEIMTGYVERDIIILSPLVKGRKGHYSELFATLQKKGFSKVRVDGEIKSITPKMKLERYAIHDIELVVDKFGVNPNNEKRAYQSVELALKMSEGSIMVLDADKSSKDKKIELFSIKNSCPNCGRAYDELAPNMFSFNSAYGACELCEGLGYIRDFDIELLIPNENKSFNEGAVRFIGKPKTNWRWNVIAPFLDEYQDAMRKPINELDDDTFEYLLFGDSSDEEGFGGIMALVWDYYVNLADTKERKELDACMYERECPHCEGSRLKKETLAVKIQGHNINDLCTIDIDDLLDLSKSISSKITKRQNLIANLIFKEIHTRLQFLLDVGLSYITLSRNVRTLSGGESQRIRLASQIGSQLVGVMYVLDEPSIGLHQHDNNKLINSLKKLRDIGNTVIVVEHDKAMIEQADYLIDVGPGAGIHGGEIILTGSPQDVIKNKKKFIGYDKSLTAKYLSGEKRIDIPENRREGNGNFIEILRASGNNLKNVNLKIPLGTFTCVTGMSGSGKSTLINHTLYPVLSNRFNSRSIDHPLPYEESKGLENIDKVIEIDQKPIGRTPRSNPATYTGLFTLIRDLFALLPESKVRGYKPGRFSFNVKGGRCEECQGAGMKKIEMNFLPDVYVQCDICEGKRYNDETLMVKYKDKSISDVLNMSVYEAKDFFSEIPKIKKKIATLNEVGLGYIKLGQQAPTLSGGEAQRVKLATELSKIGTGKTLYLLDEPTTGLHFEDVNVLLKLLDKLVDKGNTVIVIEHNLDVIKYADYIIDLGPEGGKNGGKIIAQGTPEKIIKSKTSLTGKYLKEEIKETLKSEDKFKKSEEKGKKK